MIWRTHFVPEIRLYTEVPLTIIQSCLLQLPDTADSEMKVMGGFPSSRLEESLCCVPVAGLLTTLIKRKSVSIQCFLLFLI